MRPHVTKAFTVLGLALVAWGLVVFIGRSAALDAANRTIAQQKEENAAKVEAVYRLSREMIRQESLKVVHAERALARARANADKALDSAETATAGSLAVLQDSAATVPQLRGALVVQVATTERITAEFAEFMSASFAAQNAAEQERKALYRSLTLADSTVVALKEVNQALRKVGECRIIGPIRCPTRTQAFVGGALVTLGVILAVR